MIITYANEGTENRYIMLIPEDFNTTSPICELIVHKHPLFLQQKQ